MIHYLDKKGHQLSPTEWDRLIRDPEYVRVDYTETDAFSIRTSWLGVAASWQTRIKIFCTKTQKKKRMPDKTWQPDGPAEWKWHSTEAAARQWHNHVIKEMDCVGR